MFEHKIYNKNSTCFAHSFHFPMMPNKIYKTHTTVITKDLLYTQNGYMPVFLFNVYSGNEVWKGIWNQTYTVKKTVFKNKIL